MGCLPSADRAMLTRRTLQQMLDDKLVPPSAHVDPPLGAMSRVALAVGGALLLGIGSPSTVPCDNRRQTAAKLLEVTAAILERDGEAGAGGAEVDTAAMVSQIQESAESAACLVGALLRQVRSPSGAHAAATAVVLYALRDDDAGLVKCASAALKRAAPCRPTAWPLLRAALSAQQETARLTREPTQLDGGLELRAGRCADGLGAELVAAADAAGRVSELGELVDDWTAQLGSTEVSDSCHFP